MQTLSKEQIKPSTRPALIGSNWELFMPSSHEDHDLHMTDETNLALRKAEIVIRAQEERIQLLEKMTLTDELTGLVNRRGFTAAFERELTLAKRDSTYGGILVMVDLDGFKLINDTWGHQAGDAYLCAVADVLREDVRGSDIVARMGGDEFALLLTHMDEKAGAKRLTKLEESFNKRVFVLNKRIPLRASFGFASYVGTDLLDGVVQSADMRLYAHKSRNKTLRVAGASAL